MTVNQKKDKMRQIVSEFKQKASECQHLSQELASLSRSSGNITLDYYARVEINSRMFSSEGLIDLLTRIERELTENESDRSID